MPKKIWNRWETMWEDMIRSGKTVNVSAIVTTPAIMSKRFGISRERARQILQKMERLGYAKINTEPVFENTGARTIIENPKKPSLK